MPRVRVEVSTAAVCDGYTTVARIL